MMTVRQSVAACGEEEEWREWLRVRLVLIIKGVESSRVESSSRGGRHSPTPLPRSLTHAAHSSIQASIKGAKKQPDRHVQKKKRKKCWAGAGGVAVSAIFVYKRTPGM